ncbi:hypothetical protein M1328_00675 [Patescibacteria group bacterium]|nr:hypothetical protein [Patescibacteria group bacterium]
MSAVASELKKMGAKIASNDQPTLPNQPNSYFLLVRLLG